MSWPSAGGSFRSVLSPVAKLLRANITPFSSVSKDGLAIAQYLDTFGECKVLLIGDASHGTSEFYCVRAALTKYMISHHGFNIVAIESDRPDAEAIDRYVRHRSGLGFTSNVQPSEKAKKARREPAISRFPSWMWRNHNDGTSRNSTGFYGLDLYSLQTSINAVIDYLDHVDQQMAELARKRYERLLVWAEQPHEVW